MTSATQDSLLLPLLHLRDADNRLQHARLQPNEEWPVAVPPSSPPCFPLLVGFKSFEVTSMPRGEKALQEALSTPLDIEWVTDSQAWSPSTWMHPRTLHIYAAGDDPAEVEPLATVEASRGDERTFFTLYQLCQLDHAIEHVTNWPSFYSPATDKVSTVACEEKARGRAHASCRCMKVVSLNADLELAAATHPAGAKVTVSVYLEAGAFELDRRLSAGPAEWSDAHDEYEAALVGDRPNSASDTSKALRRLLLGMLEQPEQSGLKMGPDSCLRTMNGYAGVREVDVASSSSSVASSSAASRSDATLDAGPLQP